MEIIWLPSALYDFACLLDNVEALFGHLVAVKVRQKLTSHINLLASFPRIGVHDSDFSDASREIRYLVNTPNLIYYAISRNEIVIISILDSRQSPETIRRILTENLK